MKCCSVFVELVGFYSALRSVHLKKKKKMCISGSGVNTLLHYTTLQS